MIRFLAVLACLVLALRAMAADYPQAWVQHVADGQIEVRAVTAPGMPCPAITVEGFATDSTVRHAATDGRYPVQVCVVRLPDSARDLRADGLRLPNPARTLRRLVILGDTGCRLKGTDAQDCNSPALWPFAAVARLAAARKPDLVIHVGDYHYREDPCPTGRPGCAGSPHGDNWAVWQADFFVPAAPLLAAAPWLMTRGNHELCNRGGIGWFVLLDPRAATACVAMTPPYALNIGGQQFLVHDSADASDEPAATANDAAFRAQFAELHAVARPGAWLLTHRPIWALDQFQGVPAGKAINPVLQRAIHGQVPPGLALIVSGHIHVFESFDFGGLRPAQLVVGNGGSKEYGIGQPVAPGNLIDGLPVRASIAFSDYGYLVLDRMAGGWLGTVHGVDDAVLARCRVSGRALRCSRTG
jgi:hypothetical protein